MLVHVEITTCTFFSRKYVKLDQKSRKSVQTSRRVNPMVEANFLIRWPLRLGASLWIQWEGVPTKDAGNQCIAKLVRDLLKLST